MAYVPGDDLPLFAAYIWLDTGHNTLRIGLPPDAQHARGHSVSIPLEKCSIETNESGSATLTRQRGWETLLVLLKARARSDGPKREQIGRASAITQDQLDMAIRAGRAYGQGYDTRGIPKIVEAQDLGELGE